MSGEAANQRTDGGSGGAETPSSEPAWVSEWMIDRTLEVWGKKFARARGRAMTRADAIETIRRAGGLGVALGMLDKFEPKLG
ncbi:MAG TPA: hypothetical protein PKE29_13470 [Phycisphaerales bacterium]|nr:hypothetical protein [Phycisphaerales bacterium]